MTRTPPLLLVVLGVISGVVTLLLQVGLGAAGLSKLVPQLTLSVTLLLIGVLVVLLALPIRRATRGARGARGADRSQKRRVDPFYATRVVLIAKASAVAGAILGGAGVGMLTELLARPVSSAGAIWGAVAMLVASVVVLGAGLVAESWCTVPPEDDTKTPPSAAA